MPPRHISDQRIAPCPRRRGQAIIEYVLLVAFVTLIFGSMFSMIRRGTFHLWVCEIYPRVGAIRGCPNTDDCWRGLRATSAATGNEAVVDAIIGLCK